MSFRRFLPSRSGFSLLELTLVMAFLLLFSAGVLEIFFRSVAGNQNVLSLQQSRVAWNAIQNELTAEEGQATDVNWNAGGSILTFTLTSGTASYQVQQNQWMKNSGQGWIAIPQASNIRNFTPTIISNANGKLLVLTVDFGHVMEVLHARSAFFVP